MRKKLKKIGNTCPGKALFTSEPLVETENNLCYRNKLDIKSTGKHVEIFTGPYNYNVNCA